MIEAFGRAAVHQGWHTASEEYLQDSVQHHSKHPSDAISQGIHPANFILRKAMVLSIQHCQILELQPDLVVFHASSLELLQ